MDGITEYLPKNYGNEGLLILRRQRGEKIVIGDDITIVLTEIRSGWVKIGIDAPRSINIRRAEVKDNREVANG